MGSSSARSESTLDPNSNTWHLTVVRTRGLTFLRPERSWRPIVSVSIVDPHRDHGLPHEVVLGSDGQNPNLRSGIYIHEVQRTTKLDLQIFHKSQTKKKHRKRNLVGSASLSLDEFLRKHPLPHQRPVNYDVRLSCPPPQRKSSTIAGKQQRSAMLTLRIVVPHESRPMTHVTEHYETEHCETEPPLSDAPSSSRALSETLFTSTPEREDETMLPWGKQPEDDRLDGTAGLRRRRKKPIRGFTIDSESEVETSSGEESCLPQTPEHEHFPPPYDDGEGGKVLAQGLGEVDVASPRILPMHVGQGSVMVSTPQTGPSLVERCLYWVSPYEDLKEADAVGDLDKAEKVLARLLTEWYVVGASLLALAGIDAAIFGLSPGSLFVLDNFAVSCVSIGAIAAGLGLVYDAWFLVLYSGASGTKFMRLAKDVYNRYVFFCLTCRLPILCMAVSTVCLMCFLLAVAWKAWPAAVLVMCFVAGLLFTSQFVIFGIHRMVNLIVWATRVSWRSVSRMTRSPAPPANAEVPLGARVSGRHRSRERRWESSPRIMMPIPHLTPAPAVASPEHLTATPMVWIQQPEDHKNTKMS